MVERNIRLPILDDLKEIYTEDYEALKEKKLSLEALKTKIETNKNDVSDYDISVGETWVGDLYEDAYDYQQTLTADLTNLLDQIDTAIGEVKLAILDVNQKLNYINTQIAEREG